MITRLNSHGQSFIFHSQWDKTVEVQYKDKKILINHPIETLMRSWNQWVEGVMIQDAFSYLTSDQREFLMTGILPEEWDSMFQEIE